MVKTVFGFIDRINERNQAFIKVLAKVQKNRLHKVENYFEEFPNNGKIFYYNVPTDSYVGQLGFYTLAESNTYDSNIPVSSKYVVSKEVSNLGYFEIVEIDYSFLTQKSEILSIIKNGISKTHEFTSKVLLLTTDDYLIGPYSPKLNKDNQWIAEFNDSGLLEVRKNNIEFIKYDDVNCGVYRYFVSTAFIDMEVEHYLDCSTNERVVREALKILKDEKEVRDITRRVTKMLGDLVSESPEEVRKERISRAIYLLQSHLISDDEVDLFERELLQYGAVTAKINNKVEGNLVEAKKKLEDEHKKIINETKRLNLEKEKLKVELKDVTEKRKLVENSLKKAEEALQLKIKEMQQNVYQTLLNLLPVSTLPSMETEALSTVTNTSSSQWFVQEQEQELIIDEVEILINKIVTNLERINVGKERAEFIALTSIGAILFRKPIIIKGENSFDIAQILGWTIAGNDHITIFPDIKGYSNETLISYFSHYTRVDTIKSLHVSNIENSSAELYIPSFIDYWGVATNKSYPELLIISVKDTTEISESFLDRLKYAPIISTDSIGTKGELRKARLLGEITFGCISTKSFVETELLGTKSRVFKEFKDVLEEITGMHSKIISNEFKKWFCLFEKGNADEEEITRWILQALLQNYINIEQFNILVDELDIELSECLI